MIFLDSSDPKEIKDISAWGILSGITTNPLIIAKEGGNVDLETRMRAILGEIQDGSFAREWSGAGPEAAEMLARVKAIRDQLPLNAWEQRTRVAFRIGDAAPKS